MARQLLGVGVSVLLGWPHMVHAQKANGVHTSPGHPLIVGRPVTPYAPPRAIAPRPASPPPTSPHPAPAPLARYWQAPDSASKSDQAHQMNLVLYKGIRIPNDFLRSNAYTVSSTIPYARFLVQVIVQPDGSVTPRLLKQVVEAMDTTASAFDLLRQEAQRSVSTLRFVPSTTRDTIEVPLTFSIQ